MRLDVGCLYWQAEFRAELVHFRGKKEEVAPPLLLPGRWMMALEGWISDRRAAACALFKLVTEVRWERWCPLMDGPRRRRTEASTRRARGEVTKYKQVQIHRKAYFVRYQAFERTQKQIVWQDLWRKKKPAIMYFPWDPGGPEPGPSRWKRLATRIEKEGLSITLMSTSAGADSRGFGEIRGPTSEVQQLVDWMEKHGTRKNGITRRLVTSRKPKVIVNGLKKHWRAHAASVSSPGGRIDKGHLRTNSSARHGNRGRLHSLGESCRRPLKLR